MNGMMHEGGGGENLPKTGDGPLLRLSHEYYCSMGSKDPHPSKHGMSYDPSTVPVKQ